MITLWLTQTEVNNLLSALDYATEDLVYRLNYGGDFDEEGDKEHVNEQIDLYDDLKLVLYEAMNGKT